MTLTEAGAQTHVVLVSFAVPHPGLQGDPMICWGIVQQLRATGCRVTVVLLEEPGPDQRQEQVRMLRDVANEGFHVISVPSGPVPARRPHYRVLLRPQLEDFYPSASMAFATAQTVKGLQPDVIIGFDFRAIAALRQVRDIPRIGATPSWNPMAKLGRWRHATPPAWSLDYLRTSLGLMKLVREPRFLTELMCSCDIAGHFAAQHAAWLRAHGVPECRYYRMTLVDPAGSDGMRPATARVGRPKIVMVGRLSGTLTLAGLYLFARETLPDLNRRFGADGFDVHIIGRDTLPPELARRLAHPAVRVRGFVDDLAAELLSADILLVPNPIPFSFRVRLLTGFAYGCCVVAHAANAIGTPECVHRDNILLGRDGRALGRLVWEAAHDPALRERLGRSARMTYEQWFSPQAKAEGLRADVERLTGRAAVLSEVVT